MYITAKFIHTRKVHRIVSATEILDNSHLYAIQTLDDLNEVEWDMPNVVGNWSVKDTVTHLASYEHLLLEILQSFVGQASDRPYIAAYRKGQESFNQSQVEQRKYETAQHVMDDYQDTQMQTSSLLVQIPVDKVEQEGTLPVSDTNPSGSLAKLVENLAEHSRSHCDQIRAFRQRANQ